MFPWFSAQEAKTVGLPLTHTGTATDVGFVGRDRLGHQCSARGITQAIASVFCSKFEITMRRPRECNCSLLKNPGFRGNSGSTASNGSHRHTDSIKSQRDKISKAGSGGAQSPKLQYPEVRLRRGRADQAPPQAAGGSVERAVTVVTASSGQRPENWHLVRVGLTLPVREGSEGGLTPAAEQQELSIHNVVYRNSGRSRRAN